MNGKSFSSIAPPVALQPVFPVPAAIEPFSPDEHDVPEWLKPTPGAAGPAPRFAALRDLLRILAVTAALAAAGVALGVMLAMWQSGVWP